MDKHASMHLYICVMESVSFYKPKGKGEGTTRFIQHSVSSIRRPPPPSPISFNDAQLFSPCIENCQQKDVNVFMWQSSLQGQPKKKKGRQEREVRPPLPLRL